MSAPDPRRPADPVGPADPVDRDHPERSGAPVGASAGSQGWVRDAVRLSVGTLTAVPVPPPRRVDRRVAGAAMALAPLSVVPVALGAALLAAVPVLLGAPPLLGAVVLVGTLVLGTRAMHLDGLADLADGLSSGFDRERALAVMKRSDIGPSGVTAVVLALLVQVAAASGLVGGGGTGVDSGGLAMWVLGVVASRQTLAWACRAGVPAAAPGGLGASVAGTVSPPTLTLSTLLVLGAAAALGLATGRPYAVLVPLGAIAAASLVLARARAGLGGITGDVLGAVVEVALAAALAVAAVA